MGRNTCCKVLADGYMHASGRIRSRCVRVGGGPLLRVLVCQNMTEYAGMTMPPASHAGRARFFNTVKYRTAGYMSYGTGPQPKTPFRPVSSQRSCQSFFRLFEKPKIHLHLVTLGLVLWSAPPCRKAFGYTAFGRTCLLMRSRTEGCKSSLALRSIIRSTMQAVRC